jgi:UPF0716 protein FxsA
LHADSSGAHILLAGILLAIPGFITDVMGLMLLIGPLRRALGAALGAGQKRPRGEGAVDLPPEQWRRVPDPALTDWRDNDGNH